MGKPVVVASDKAKTPSTVDKIASSLGANIFEPEEDLSSQKKEELGVGDNAHEKDASASALNAYNHLQREIRKIEDLAEEEDVSMSIAAQNYFLDKPLPSEETEEEQKEENKETKDSKQEESKVDREKQRLQDKIDNLEEQNQQLEDRIESLESDKADLQYKLDDLRERDRLEAIKEQEITKRDAIISEKGNEISELKDELNRTSLREKQYRRAIKKIYRGNYVELVPKEDGQVIFKSDKYDINDLDGVELGNYFLLLEKPEPDMGKVLEEFKDKNGGVS